MDDESLFRREAIAHRGDRLFGGATLPRPLSLTLVSAFALAVAAALIALLLLGTYARKQTVVGHLAPAGGLVKIVPAQPGTVERSLIREGQRVAGGEILFVISTRRSGEQLGDVDARILDELRVERSALKRQIERQRELDIIEAAASAQKAADIRGQLRLLERRRASLDDRVAQRTQILQRLAPVAAAGHVPRMRLEEAEAAVLEARIDRQVLDQDSARLGALLRAQELEIDSLPGRQAIRIGEFEKALSGIGRRLAEAGMRRSHTIAAPVAGSIGSLQAHVGTAVVPGRPLATLVPESDELRAVLLVPARAIGFLARGQRVRLRYAAYPYQKFGLYDGTIAGIGRTILLPEEMQGPVAMPEPAYRVTVRLAQQSVSADGLELPLRPGISLEADIIRDRRQIIHWLFEPLYGAIARNR
ncbi:MAG: HlyD family efflux transporter periplasmic adaptor subunit [Gammaproteobacteria bacterium]